MTTDDSDIEKLVELAAQQNSQMARQRLFQAMRRVEVFFPCNMDRHDGKKVRSTPLARLPDGTHAMMLFTSKSHPHLSEHEHFAGGTFEDALAAALKMPPLDWVILWNNASRSVAIAKGQIPEILDDLRSDRQAQNSSSGSSEEDPTGKMLEDLITRIVKSKSKEFPLQVETLLQARELFLDLVDGKNREGQPAMKTFHIEHLPRLIRVYTSRVRPGITYGGIRWEALKDMIRVAPEISGVQIMNNSDDWIVFDREALGLEAGDE